MRRQKSMYGHYGCRSEACVLGEIVRGGGRPLMEDWRARQGVARAWQERGRSVAGRGAVIVESAFGFGERIVSAVR